MRRITSLAITTIIIAISTICSISAEGNNTFKDPSGQYMMQYPKNWNCKLLENTVPAFNPIENGFPNDNAWLMLNPMAIEILKIDYTFNNAEEAIDATINSYSSLEKSDYPAGFEVLKKEASDDKTEAYVICAFTERQRKRKLYIFYDNQKYYWFEYDASNEEFDKYLPCADEIMKSFKITK
jgi:hypothetical protein